ncbi:unnamed protein product [Arabis nemorensis]|uniref:Uncharacterized protein n=1 Tax=Arabis nemorensis TaxID=586526 RepID=A0A565BRX8_9BRAS|nr:unnamed protein product [Arabis nemorensis]
MTKVPRELKSLALYLSRTCVFGKVRLLCSFSSLEKLGFRRKSRSDLIFADFSGFTRTSLNYNFANMLFASSYCLDQLHGYKS